MKDVFVYCSAANGNPEITKCTSLVSDLNIMPTESAGIGPLKT